MSERDKFLTEAMGECWHKREHVNAKLYRGPGAKCEKCRKYIGVELHPDSIREHNTNFSTWEGFGKLWNWAKDQEWFCLMMAHNGCGPHDIVNPDLFANEVHKFLKQEADKP